MGTDRPPTGNPQGQQQHRLVQRTPVQLQGIWCRSNPLAVASVLVSTPPAAAAVMSSKTHKLLLCLGVYNIAARVTACEPTAHVTPSAHCAAVLSASFHRCSRAKHSRPFTVRVKAHCCLLLTVVCARLPCCPAVRALLRHGASVSARSVAPSISITPALQPPGSTALHFAAAAEDVSLVLVLLEAQVSGWKVVGGWWEAAMGLCRVGRAQRWQAGCKYNRFLGRSRSRFTRPVQ